VDPYDGPAFPIDLSLPGAPGPRAPSAMPPRLAGERATQPDMLRRDEDAYREAAAAVE
jgi:hypothetical protein